MTTRTIPLAAARKGAGEQLSDLFPGGAVLRHIELPHDLVEVGEEVPKAFFRFDEAYYRCKSRDEDEYQVFFLYKRGSDYCIYDIARVDNREFRNCDIHDLFRGMNIFNSYDFWKYAEITEDGKLALLIPSYQSERYICFCFEDNITSVLKDIYAESKSRQPIQKEKGSKMSQPLNITAKQIESKNIIGTILGVAVRATDGSWHIYDREKQEITDLGDLQFDSLPPRNKSPILSPISNRPLGGGFSSLKNIANFSAIYVIRSGCQTFTF